MKPVHRIDKSIRQLHRKAGEDLDSRIHGDIDKTLAGEQTLTPLTMRRTIMTSSITKLAAAAAVVLAALLGLNIINTPGGSVAWAQIPSHIEAIDTFMFRLTIGVRDPNGAQTPDKQKAQWTFYLSERYGFRMDIRGGDAVVSWYVPPTEDTLTMVIPGEKKWSQTPLPPEQRGKMPEEYKDPAEYLTRFLARPYKELGRSVIDGIEVKGIEVTDPPTDGEKLENGIGRLWVDAQTELPIRIEIEGTANGAAVQWLMEFKWAEAVDPASFEPNIPSGYTPLLQ
jgi:outer membrane lipoprotein-sorting protein